MTESLMYAVAANVAMHPHSEALYRQLFADAYELKRDVVLRGDRNALLSGINPEAIVPGFGSPVVKGVIATFLDFDSKAPWLDRQTLQQADDRLTRAVQIPDRLRASLARFEFVFDPRTHVVVAETEAAVTGDRTKIVRLSAGMLATFLTRLFEQAELFQKYGVVAVTAIPDPKGVEAILASQGLRQLTIIIRPPNADVLEDLAEEISERLRAQNAASFRQDLSAPRNGTLSPDEATKNLARVGALNGRVEARVANEVGGSRTVSTAKKPARFEAVYDPDVETSSAVLDRLTVEAVHSVTEARQLASTPEPEQPPPLRGAGMG